MNGEIRYPRVRLIDAEGRHAGIVELVQALDMAAQASLDLVEISPGAEPPVCRIMDYGKFRYQLNRKERDARKKQQSGGLKEIKLRPNTDQHDYDFKVKHAREFLDDHHKVKVTVMFRGRQLVYKDQGFELLQKFATDLADVASVEREPLLEGKQVTLLLAPTRK
ncbi:MAG TPA: translation initiation factor IF-3 [Candidatus Fermentibacter sp.]|nr:translation initiation factor IF-3 [Candidatus Fermentibacter sp.]